MFALVDCNNFYVSCERVFNPGLNGRAVVVLSNNDGCFISRSDEAKALGLPMGGPAFKFRKILEEHRVAVYSANFVLYGDMSSRVMNTLAGFAPAMEVYSIDEAFVDLTGFERIGFEATARSMRRTVRRDTGIPVCIGLATTKTLAKLANRKAKKEVAFGGVCILHDREDARRAMASMEVSQVWGIGRRHTEFLNANGVRTALDLADAPTEWVRRHLHITGARVQAELNGNSCLPLELVRPLKQSICTSRSFGTAVTDEASLGQAVAHFATKCALKLRGEKELASLVTVFLCTSPFEERPRRYYGTRTAALPVATQDTLAIVRAAQAVLGTLFRPGMPYKKAGVILSALTPVTGTEQHQTTLFEPEPLQVQERSARLMQALDAVNSRYGQGTLRIAADTNTSWKQRQEKLSPHYTTNWDDIIEVVTSDERG
ncbi:MAG: Y-family DNA polymerase [Chlorobiaceae bacterium]|nr:Y-family DNA polymerase [Chlorobiaceae bacterium]